MLSKPSSISPDCCASSTSSNLIFVMGASGIKTPLSFDKGPNLSDSEHVVLDLSPGSGSLPSRDYYTEENFTEQRAQFKEHLTKVAALVGGLEADFAAPPVGPLAGPYCKESLYSLAKHVTCQSESKSSTCYCLSRRQDLLSAVHSP